MLGADIGASSTRVSVAADAPPSWLEMWEQRCRICAATLYEMGVGGDEVGPETGWWHTIRSLKQLLKADGTFTL